MCWNWQNSRNPVNVFNNYNAKDDNIVSYPDYIGVAVSEALKPKYNEVNVDKVNEKYQDLKNSW